MKFLYLRSSVVYEVKYAYIIQVCVKQRCQVYNDCSFSESMLELVSVVYRC